ncbi:MFS transporter [Williamsia deligens]|uniref:MFS transporter n=1 Tax=Williamsia deligens TaxID=321325 RepID=A0ABW3G4M0_9NOCA
MRAVDRSPADTRVPDPRAWWAVAAAMAAIAWGGNEFTPLLVMYESVHGLPGPVVDALLFAYVLGIVPALLIGGPLSDRHGRVALMRPAPVIAAAGSLILALGADHVSLLVVGRVLSGVGLGLAMAVGSSWVKELSGAPWTPDASPTLGARRGAMSLTFGLGVGAAVAGVLAQWAPLQDSLAYLVNVGLCLAAAVWVWSAPETISGDRAPRRLVDDLKIRAVAQRRFVRVVVPVAPWVFGSAAAAYAVLPTLMSDRVADVRIAYAAAVTLVTLASGFAVQSVARRIDRPDRARSSVVALVFLMLGMATGGVAAYVLDPWLTLLAGAVLGAGYGMALVAGLSEVGRIAEPADLAGLTAVFYSLTYLGFGAPVVLSLVHQSIPDLTYPILFAAGVVLAVVSLVAVLSDYRDPDAVVVPDDDLDRAPSSEVSR